MKTLLRRVAPWAAVGAIVLVLAGSIWLLAVPAATTHSAVRGCSVTATTSGSGIDGPDDILPSSGLDATRQCGGNPASDQSLDEAIVAGAGLILFGGAMLVYRQKRTHHQPRRIARA